MASVEFWEGMEVLEIWEYSQLWHRKAGVGSYDGGREGGRSIHCKNQCPNTPQGIGLVHAYLPGYNAIIFIAEISLAHLRKIVNKKIIIYFAFILHLATKSPKNRCLSVTMDTGDKKGNEK